jgi:hypothetical protein
MRFVVGAWALAFFLSSVVLANSSSTLPNGRILRLRMTDGSILKVEAKEDTATLNEVVTSALRSSPEAGTIDISNIDVKVNGESLSLLSPISELDLKNGALLSIVDKATQTSSTGLKRGAGSSSKSNQAINSKHFDPFPELAKPRYTSATRAVRAKANLKGGLSFADIDKMTASLHKVETQPEPKIQRIYMCAKGAEAFATSCFVKRKKTDPPSAKPTMRHRCALLFGTVSTERLDQNRTPRTSLSSTTESAKMCKVVKVQAVWEPPSQNPPTSSLYDASSLTSLTSSSPDTNVLRAIDLATKLGYQPVGWIYSYESQEGDSREEAQVPVLSRDVVIASSIQAELMERLGREEGGKFVTLALNAPNGATEAFQMSDQSIQMTAEGVFSDTSEEEAETRHIQTSAPVVVDGKETNEVDCVLCLVNTAMLSQTGSLSQSKIKKVPSTGKLSNKTKKQIADSLAKHGSENETIELLRDFNLLFGLSKVMNSNDMTELCRIVSGYSKGRKKGSEMSKHLQLVLESISTV